jgi:hypothetical protein
MIAVQRSLRSIASILSLGSGVETWISMLCVCNHSGRSASRNGIA